VWVGDDIEGLLGLAATASAAGDPATAAELLERAVELAPGHAGGHAALGDAFRALGRSSEALAALRRAVFLDPRLAEAHNAIGSECLARGQAVEAFAAYRAALTARPGYIPAQVNLGLALQALGRIEEAHRAFHRGVELAPHLPEAWNALGTALQQLGRPEEAVAAYRRAIALRPDFAIPVGNLGRSLRDLGEVEEAIVHYDRAIALQPDFADARWNRALLYLLTGRFAEGWEEQEWRWKKPDFPSARRGFAQPLWNGEALDGATILLHAEQGFGDTLQFLRYVPLVAAAGGRVVLEVQPALARLARALAGCAEIVLRGTALPRFDWHAPLLSLPRAFGTRLETIPAIVPYLAAEPGDVGRWRTRLAGDGRKVGLVWAGSPGHINDSNRSLDPARLAPLLAVPGVRFYSLQLGRSGRLPSGVADLAPELHDFADTAAALDALDLLITVDTSAAHLAGALGRPVWTLLPFAPDWRWLERRDDAPWYPTMRLFRQSARGDWQGVIARVADALAQTSSR
jgi:tetratricopeptide (TPR) repeat protein